MSAANALEQPKEDQENKRKGNPNWKKGGPSPWAAGRPKESERENKPTNRELKERELLMLLRKIKPHVAEAIMSAAKIMKNEEASHQNQLKAATILLDNYRRLTLDLYDGDEDKLEQEGTEVQQNNAPILSLRIVDTEA